MSTRGRGVFRKKTQPPRRLQGEALESRLVLSGSSVASSLLGPAALYAGAAPKTMNQAPTVAKPLSVQYNGVGTSATLAILGADDGGEAKLTYNWSLISSPNGGTARFNANGSNAAKSTTLTFTKAGTYAVSVKITDAQGASVTQNGSITVNPTLASLVVTTADKSVTLNNTTPLAVNGASTALAVQGYDQFGTLLAAQPKFTWSATTLPAGTAAPQFSASGNTAAITFRGLGTYGITVSGVGTGTVSSTVKLAVNSTPTYVVLTPAANPVTITGTTAQFTVNGWQDQFHNGLSTTGTHYAWSAAQLPAGAAAPSIATSGASTVVTFKRSGNYVLNCTMTDASGRYAVQGVSVQVAATPTAVAATTTTTVTTAGTTATLALPTFTDQFGTALAAAPPLAWTVTTLPAGAAAPVISVSGSTATMTFAAVGNYVFHAVAVNNTQLAFTRTVTVTPTLTSIQVTPGTAAVACSGTQQFAAQGFDQFQNALAVQPTFTWSTNGGMISAAGLLGAPATAATITVTAHSGSLTAIAVVTVAANALGFQDANLAALVATLDADGTLSRSDVIQILRSAGATGVVSTADFNDLKTLLADAATLKIPNYVLVLAGDVINGNAANARYLGQPLGNLQAGSSSTVLYNLVNKWFYGADLPALTSSSFTYAAAGGSLFPHAPSHADEFQGALGDCYLVSSLGMIADSNPSAISNMITDNGDGTYTVRFYSGTYGGSYNSDGSYSDGFANGVGTADYVTINRMLPTYNGSLIYADMGATATAAANSLWIPLIEKAYAQWNETGKEGRDGKNAYNSIQGGWMATVDAQVLGYNATDYADSTPNKQVLIAALTAKKAVTIGTDTSSNSNDTLPYGLYGSHAYGVTAYNASTDTFTLYNPWGMAQPMQLTWAQIQATCGDFVVANTSGSAAFGAALAVKTPLRSPAPSDAAATTAAVFAEADMAPAAALHAASAADLASARSQSSADTIPAMHAVFDVFGAESHFVAGHEVGHGHHPVPADANGASWMDGLQATIQAAV